MDLCGVAETRYLAGLPCIDLHIFILYIMAPANLQLCRSGADTAMAVNDDLIRHLGGAASGIGVGSVGLGLMLLTTAELGGPMPDEQAFAVLNAALANRSGLSFWGSATFYTRSTTNDRPRASRTLL